MQTSLLFDLKLDKLQLYGEIMDSRGELNDENSAVGTFLVNTLEPIQAYAAWTLPDSLREGDNEHAARRSPHARHRQAPARLPQPLSQHREHVYRRGLAVARSRPAKNARAIYLIPMRNLPTRFDELLDDEFELDHGQRDTQSGAGTTNSRGAREATPSRSTASTHDSTERARTPPPTSTTCVGRHTRVSGGRQRPLELRGRGRLANRQLGRHRRRCAAPRPRPSGSPAARRVRLPVRRGVGAEFAVHVRRRERRQGSARRQ